FRRHAGAKDRERRVSLLAGPALGLLPEHESRRGARGQGIRVGSLPRRRWAARGLRRASRSHRRTTPRKPRVAGAGVLLIAEVPTGRVDLVYSHCPSRMSTVRRHEYLCTFSNPCAHNSARVPADVSTWRSALAMAATSSASTTRAPLPATSGQLVLLDVITGQPHVCASRIGIPKPSYRETYTRAS